MSGAARAVRWATDYAQYVKERGYLLASGRFVLLTEQQRRSSDRNAFELGRDCEQAHPH